MVNCATLADNFNFLTNFHRSSPHSFSCLSKMLYLVMLKPLNPQAHSPGSTQPLSLGWGSSYRSHLQQSWVHSLRDINEGEWLRESGWKDNGDKDMWDYRAWQNCICNMQGLGRKEIIHWREGCYWLHTFEQTGEAVISLLTWQAGRKVASLDFDPQSNTWACSVPQIMTPERARQFHFLNTSHCKNSGHNAPLTHLITTLPTSNYFLNLALQGFPMPKFTPLPKAIAMA